MRLYLVRHAQSVNNALAAVGSSEDRVFDPPLTEIGLQQADLVAQHLQDTMDMPPDRREEPFGLTHLYCSAMTRSLQTTKPIAAALGLSAEVWIDIHEIGGLFLNDASGIKGFPGLTRSQIETDFPGTIMPDTITEDGWWDAASGRETLDAFISRSIRVALALRERATSYERIALVTHGAFMDALVKALLERSPQSPDAMFFVHYNTSITRFDFGPDAIYDGADVRSERLRLHYMNRVAHLPHELRTS